MISTAVSNSLSVSTTAPGLEARYLRSRPLLQPRASPRYVLFDLRRRRELLDLPCYGCHEHQKARIEAGHREEGIGNTRTVSDATAAPAASAEKAAVDKVVSAT